MDEATKTLRRIGNTDYRGFDYNQRPIHVRPGEIFTCSARRADRLLADYPHGFEVVGDGSPGDPAGRPLGQTVPAPTTPDPTRRKRRGGR